jgi:predicted nucleic acid-binding Zn ribbon protein
LALCKASRIFAEKQNDMNGYDEERHCMNCGKTLSGRPDKLFCSQRCKNEWHNRINGMEKRRRDRTFAILWKNYKILELMADSGMRETDMSSLSACGFNPDFITGFRKLRNGRADYFCFDIAYNKTEARLYNIRRTSELF